MDYTLTEEQEQLRRLVEEFVLGDVNPYFEKHGHEDFAWPLFRKLDPSVVDEELRRLGGEADAA